MAASLNLKLSDFDYALPKELIAQYPPKERDAARLLVVDRAKGDIRHRFFRDILEYLNADDLLVLNDTKVLASRLLGRRVSGGKVEVLLTGHKEKFTFNALIKPARVRLNEKIIFADSSVSGVISAKNEITFSAADIESIYRLGVVPLPPYIKRDAERLDDIYYQTVYAKSEGAKASPTAGLHFTTPLLDEITAHKVKLAYITLHVGYSTFRPVKDDDITKHKMGSEYLRISDEQALAIDLAKKKNNHIIAVGTTSCRTLEAYAGGMRQGYTDLFIYPGYKFKTVDCLLTNFHLPKTTLFILACAFAGEQLIKEAYRQAIEMKYRFYSYGDAMLIV